MLTVHHTPRRRLVSVGKRKRNCHRSPPRRRNSCWRMTLKINFIAGSVIKFASQTTTLPLSLPLTRRPLFLPVHPWRCTLRMCVLDDVNVNNFITMHHAGRLQCIQNVSLDIIRPLIVQLRGVSAAARRRIQDERRTQHLARQSGSPRRTTT